MRVLGETPVLGWAIRALRECKFVDEIVVATSTDESDNPIATYCDSIGVFCHRGPMNDVLSRFIGALEQRPADGVVRITADCPFIDPEIVDLVVGAWVRSDWLDHLSTTNPRCLPRGLDVEIASFRAMQKIDTYASGVDRVHVTSGIYGDRDQFKTGGVVLYPDNSDLRVTLDTSEDWAVLQEVVQAKGDRVIPRDEIIDYLRQNPNIQAVNAGVRQKALNEG